MAFLTQRTKPKIISIISILALLVFLPLLLLAVQNIAVLITRATGTTANIAVDTKAILEPINTDFYHAFAQGGEESKDMLAPVLSDIRALKPKFIRLDHLYDHYNVVGRNGAGLTFDFTRLDAAVASILAAGAKPVLVLSYMPSVIAKDGNITNPPTDWNDWALVVQKTIEHYSGRAEKNINGIYYEVWNEPDLAQFGGWKYSGDKNYLTLYHWAAVAATNAQNVDTFYLGGPATTGLYKEWITALITSGNRIDFISWHTYQTDPKAYDTDQRNIISWLLPYPNHTLVPLLITEFGFTGDKSTLYGTQYAAAYTAAVIRQLITGAPLYLFSFQPVDGVNQQDGSGWGLITNPDNGLTKKPRYYVYNFIDGMAGNRLALSGEGTWVTGFASIKDNIIRTLLVNFDRNGSHTETVPVTLKNLDPGTYLLRTRYLFGTDTTTTEVATNSSLLKNIPMTAQNVVILELSKQSP
jgi:Glycosyl hydrolases family 39